MFPLSFRNVQGKIAYVADTYGTWVELQHRSPSCQATIRSMIQTARRQSSLDVSSYTIDVALNEANGYAMYLAEGLPLTANHVSQVALHVRQRILSGKEEVPNAAYEEFDRRSLRPMIPMEGGGSLDLTAGSMMSHFDTCECLLRAHGWILPMIQPEIVNSQSPGACAMRNAIENRFGQTLITRLARHALGTSKNIDVMIAPKDWGKSTLITLMEFAFPGMVGRLAADKSLSEQGKRFSQIEISLASKIWVFVDEAGEEPQRTIRAAMTKTFVDDIVQVERKGEDNRPLPA